GTGEERHLNRPLQDAAVHGLSPRRRALGHSLSRACCGFLAGRARGRLDPFGELPAASLAVPLLEGLVRDLALDEQLSELAPLRLALERHDRNACIRRSVCRSTERLDS